MSGSSAFVTTAPGGHGAARRRANRSVAGLDRVLWQRIDPTTGRGRVAGIRHRRPVTVTVSAMTAARLHDEGLPTVVAGGTDT